MSNMKNCIGDWAEVLNFETKQHNDTSTLNLFKCANESNI